MPDPFPTARTETFEHTISGLLTKRREMLTEAERLRDRMADINIAALLYFIMYQNTRYNK